MLHAPLLQTAAKLDISRLIESSPSPQPRQVTLEAQPKHGARSASDPPPARANPRASGRSSISSNNSSGSSYAALSASSLPPNLNHNHPYHHHQQQQPQREEQQQSSSQLYEPNHYDRPRMPSVSAVSLPAPISHPSGPQRHSAHSVSTSSLPEPSSFVYPHPPKRPAPSEPHPSASPAKRQSKWTAEEDALVIELRGAGMKWEDISKRIPGRTPLSCRLHYQNYIERRSQWDEDRKNRLARLYERLKPEMWKPLAAELNVPWRAAEAMHWQLGQTEMARRAGVTPFSISGGSAGPSGPSGTRLEGSLAEGPSTATYLQQSPFTGGGYVVSNHQPTTRPGYLEEREHSLRGSIYGRARSTSASSSIEERRGSTQYGASTWALQPPSAGSDRRYSQESWPLPRLPEIDDSAPHSHEASQS